MPGEGARRGRAEYAVSGGYGSGGGVGCAADFGRRRFVDEFLCLESVKIREILLILQSQAIC